MAGIKDKIKRGEPEAPSKFIIMGDPMTGKTTLAAKAPKPLFLSTDGNAAKAGLDAIDITDLQTLRDAVNYFAEAKEYDTVVIDTIEGIADLFEKVVIEEWNAENGQHATSLSDVAYGRLTGRFNRRIAAFGETLAGLNKNVILITYTKRSIDDVSDSLVLTSELKQINKFTKFVSGIILTSYDGEKYRAQVTNKRTVVSGDVDYGNIEAFLKAAGWELPAKKTKVGKARG